jgi:hypothetical protein
MSSSLITLATLALVATPAVATYGLTYSFDESNFFQNFSLYSDTDPTAGYVISVAAVRRDTDCNVDLSSIWIMRQQALLALPLPSQEMST